MPPPLYALHAAAQLQPIHALLPVAVGAMNIHDVRALGDSAIMRYISRVFY